jgi:hypothetical protein
MGNVCLGHTLELCNKKEGFFSDIGDINPADSWFINFDPDNVNVLASTLCHFPNTCVVAQYQHI